MKVLVTGANGFVGKSVVRRLLADGDRVVAAVGPGASGSPGAPNLTNVSLDLANDVSVRACFAEPVDAVIHLAAIALSRAADRDPAMAWSVNALRKRTAFSRPLPIAPASSAPSSRWSRRRAAVG